MNQVLDVYKFRTRLLISGDLLYFSTIVRKVNMSSCWCHWFNLSSKEWLYALHTKEMLWTIDLMKNL